jgi:hypothetical protein
MIDFKIFQLTSVGRGASEMRRSVARVVEKAQEFGPPSEEPMSTFVLFLL